MVAVIDVRPYSADARDGTAEQKRRKLTKKMKARLREAVVKGFLGRQHGAWSTFF